MNKQVDDDLRGIRKNRKRYALLLLPAALLVFIIAVQNLRHDAKSNPEIKSYLKAVAACEDIESEDLRLRCVRMMENLDLMLEPGAEDPCANPANADLAARCRTERVRRLAATDPEAAFALCKMREGYDLNCVADVGGYAALKTLSRGDEFCQARKTIALKAACYRGLATQIGVIDRGAAKAVCDLLETPSVQKACYDGLGVAMAQGKD